MIKFNAIEIFILVLHVTNYFLMYTCDDVQVPGTGNVKDMNFGTCKSQDPTFPLSEIKLTAGGIMGEFFTTFPIPYKHVDNRDKSLHIAVPTSTQTEYVFGKFYVKVTHNAQRNVWLEYSKFGPLFVRLTDKRWRWKLFTNVAGYMGFNFNALEKRDEVQFRFFLQNPIEYEPFDNFKSYGFEEGQTIFDVSGKIASHDSGNNCDFTYASPSKILSMTILPKSDKMQPRVTINNAKLTLQNTPKHGANDRLAFSWSLNEEMAEQTGANCQRKIQIIMYESQPREGVNKEIRPVLARLSRAVNEGETSGQYSFQLSEDPYYHRHQIIFLYKSQSLRKQDLYLGWTKEKGISIAVALCECGETDCYGYSYSPVTIAGEWSNVVTATRGGSILLTETDDQVPPLYAHTSGTVMGTAVGI